MNKLKTSSLENFKNDEKAIRKTKNLNIKISSELIDKFKIIAFDYYKKNNSLKLFSFRHYIGLVILNIENEFLEKYGEVLEPDEDYIQFYKKRGTKANLKRNTDELDTINFLLPLRFADKYFNLMHTYYVMEQEDKNSYSISLFFEFVVQWVLLKNNDLKDYQIEL